MATRQERLKRHQRAEEARARLKSGAGKSSQQDQGPYQSTRQKRMNAYQEAHPTPAPTAPHKIGTSFSGDPQMRELNVPNALKQFQHDHAAPVPPVMQKPFTGGSIPDSSAALRDTFTNKPGDSRLLRSNNNVHSTGAPKKALHPFTAAYDQVIHGAQSAVDFQQQPTNEVPTTGSKGVDSFLRGTGAFLPGLMTGQPGAAFSGAGANALDSLAGKVVPKATSVLFKASPKAAYVVQKAAPGVSKVAGHALDAGLENARIGAAAGQTDAKQVEENFGMGAVLGGGGSALTSGAKTAFTKLFKRSGMTDSAAVKAVEDTVIQKPQEQLALPLGREDAARLRRAPKNGTEPIVNPYTFGLPEPKPQPAAAGTPARIAQRVNPYREKYNELIGLAHETRFTPGRELEELDQLWSSIAGKEDPSLDELIKLAHPTHFNKAEPGLVGKAKDYQAAREVAGAPLPVKGREPAPPQGVIADAAPITQRVGRRPVEAPAAEPLKTKQELPKQVKKAPGDAPLPKAKPNDAIAQLDKEHKDYKDSINKSVANGIRNRQEADKAIKGHAMRTAAEKRRIIQGDSLVPVEGGLTGKELADKIAHMKTNHTGKKVIVDGKHGTVTKMSFGKVGVKFEDGSESFHAPGQVKPAADVEATIKKQQQLPKQQPKADPLKPKQELPKKPKAEPVRSNYATMQEAEGLSPELKKEIAKNDARYEPITNKETVATADTEISKEGVDKSVQDFLSDDTTDAKNIAKGYRLMQILDARGNHKVAATVAAKVAENLTKAGQQAQAGRIISKLSPEGQKLALTRKATESGKPVTPEDAKNFSAAAKQYAETTNAELRTNTVQDVIDKVKAGKVPTAEDIKVLESAVQRAKKQLPADKPKAKAEPTKKSQVLDKLQKAEDEAWARIKKRRNIGFTPGKGNELVDYAIIAANRVARGTVKASNHVEQIVKLFGEDIRPHATKVYNMSLKHVARHPELKTIKQNISTAEEVVEQWAKKTSTTGKDLEKVRELAKAVGSLEGKQGKAADVQMQQIMNKYEKWSPTDQAQSIRFMAMLGNTHTQLLNASSNLGMAALYNSVDVLGAMVDMSLSALLKRPRTTTAIGENPFSFLGHMFQNMWEGGKANFKGVNPGGLHSVDEIHGLAFKWKLNPLHWAERSLKAVAGGMDYGIYKTQFNNEILKQARLAAKKVPKQKRVKFIRDFRANPPSEALEIADDMGRKGTFQQKNSLGDLAASVPNRLGNIKGKGRIPGKILEQGIRAVSPFIRTPFNILDTGVSLTPAGILRGGIQLAFAKTAAQQREAISHMSLGILGTGMTGAGFYLHKIGLITDANDSGNSRVDEVRTESGAGAYRFNQSGMMRYMKAIMAGEGVKAAEKVAPYQDGDRTFNYNKLQPLAFSVALGAGIQKGGLKEGLTQAGGSLLSMSMLKSIQDAVSTGYSGSEGEKQLGVFNRVAESYLKSFSPSLLAQETRRTDTTTRQTSFNQGFKKDLGDYYKSRIPSLGGRVPEKFTSKSLPEKVTPLGQTKQGIHNNFAGNYLNPIQSDIQQYSKAAAIIGMLIDKTGDDNIAPSAPAKKIQGVDIPPKRYAQYQRDIGNAITEKVLAIGQNQNIGDEEKVKRIAQTMLDVKAKYRDKMKKELGIKDKLR